MFQKKAPTLFTGLLAAGCLSIGGFAFPQAVLADVTAVFESPEGEMTIEYRDDDHVRMRTADNSFFVIREGKGYMVNREDGEWFVIAVDDMIRMMGAAGVRPGATADADATDFDLRDTGRSESIAGIEGRIYEYSERDSWSGDSGPTTEVVISDDPDARAIYRGIMRTTEILGVMADKEMEGQPANAPQLEDSGLLRYGNEWRLVSIHSDPIPDRHFSLPAEPRPMPGFGGPTGSRGQPAWAEKEAEEIGRTAADEAREIREETRRDASNEVREGVRDGIRGLFGR